MKVEKHYCDGCGVERLQGELSSIGLGATVDNGDGTIKCRTVNFTDWKELCNGCVDFVKAEAKASINKIKEDFRVRQQPIFGSHRK